jgi:3-dehydroquinate dehydratase
LKLPGKTLAVGREPRVIGTFSSRPQDFSRLVPEIASDIVELRVDQMEPGSGWLECGEAVEASGAPVIVTIRHNSEGGGWKGPEKKRLELY